MSSERGPIKVGTGYVEIVPKVLAKDMAELRGKITGELEKIGLAASKEMNEAVTKGLANLPKEVKKQATKAKQAVEAEAKDSAETIAELEKFVTKQYGEQAKKRLAELRKFYESYEGMTEEATGTTKQALRETVRQEEKAAKDRLQAEKDRVRESERLARQQTQDADRQQRQQVTDQKRAQQQQVQAQREALRQQVQAQRDAVRQQVADIRAQATAQRTAIQQQISDQQSAILQARSDIRGLRRSIADANTATASMFKRTETSLKNMGTWFHEAGTSITEAGNLISTKFLAPLAMAGTALSAIGITNADKRLLGQLGLTSAGVSTKESAKQMTAIQQYAINTPYSIDVMHEYQMKLIRSVAGSDKKWYSKDPDVRTNAANKAAGKTTDLIMAIGDSMARAGNLDPEQFRRAMYAMDMIMDMDRAPTRNLKQLASASGMPASELAHLLGFKNSQELWKVVGTPANKAKKGVKAGVQGTEIMNALLNYWNPDEYKGHQKGDGSKGFAEKLTSQTITGRVQQMKERATFELGNLFIKEDKKTGKYDYTSLGEKIMGKKVPMYKYDRKGEQTLVGYRNEGGILNQVQDMAKKYAPDVKKFLGSFLDSVSRFVKMIDQVVGWVKSSGLDKLAIAVGNFLVQWGPMILAVGLLSKLFGKLLKIGGAALGPLRAVGRGVVGTYDAVRGSRQRAANATDRWDARDAARREVRENSDSASRRVRRTAGRTARQDARDSGMSRRDARRVGRQARNDAGMTRGSVRRSARQAGRQAYRDTRTGQNGGDTRGAGRRVVDRVFGSRGADTSGDQRQIRALEDEIEKAQRKMSELRDELRDVNNSTMRQIADALGGNGRNSVQGAANQANQSLGNTHQAAGRLNDVHLTQVEQELTKVKEKADHLTKAFKDAGTEAKNLNDRKLGSLRAQQVETTTKRVGELEKATKDAEKAVHALNGRSLANLRDHFKGVTQAANGTTKAVKETSSAVDKLKVKSLKALKDQFGNVEDAAHKAYEIIGMGTGSKSLAGRVGLLNGRSLKKVTDAIKDLEKALKSAKDEGDGLDGALDRIGKKSPGGGGSSSSGTKKPKGKHSARGGRVTHDDANRYGVLPGYSPWVDNIPAILSPGEAVLRPEVTAALGEEKINTWNALAVRGKISRHARGTGGGARIGLDELKNLQQLQNIAPIGTAMLKTMGFDATSDDLGGSTQNGILGTGDVSAHIGGTAAADRFYDLLNWFTHDVFKFAKKTPDVVGQVAGILGGALSPTLTDYFMDDVWKGHGNIVDRGKSYLGDVFSTKTLGAVWDNLWGGVKDSAGAIWDTISNPIDTFQNAFGDIADIFSGSFNRMIDNVEVVKEIINSPYEYGGRVVSGFLDNAKEALPNTKGLFDFDNGSKVKADIPDLVNSITEPGSGKGVQRWAPVAKSALSMLRLPSTALGTVLHRIGVESGGNPDIVNNWDSNAKMGTPSVGLMQVIGPTYKRWAGPFAGTGPFKFGTSVNPLANIYAGLNYASHRYGSKWQSVLSGNKGYATGTISASPGLAMVGEKGRELVAFGGGERVFNNQETEGLLNGKKYEIHVHEARNEPTPQAVLRALQTAEALYTTL
jgi:SLT domain-containing protein